MTPPSLRKDPEQARLRMKEIHELAWPATVESIFSSLVGMVDTVMVSTLGTTAIASIGLCSQPRFLAQSFILALNVAVTALISRRIGSGRKEEASGALRQMLVCSLILSLVTCGLSIVFARPYLMLAGGNAETIDMAVAYFQIAMGAQIFQGLASTITTAQRSAGNSRISMQANVAANVLNIIFNYCWIGGHFGFPALGVRGAALATLVGSAAALMLALFSVLRSDSTLPLKPQGSWIPERELLEPLVRISAAALLEQFCLRLGGFIYARLAAGLGTVIFAAHQICVNITNILFSFFDGSVAAAAALTGRGMGAKNPDKAETTVRLTCRMSLALAVVLMAVMVPSAFWLMRLFTADSLIITQGVAVLWLCTAVLPILALRMILAGSLRGAADTRFVTVSTFFSMTVMRPFLAWLFSGPLGLGLMGIWMALVADNLVRWVCVHLRFEQGKWKRILL